MTATEFTWAVSRAFTYPEPHVFIDLPSGGLLGQDFRVHGNGAVNYVHDLNGRVPLFPAATLSFARITGPAVLATEFMRTYGDISLKAVLVVRSPRGSSLHVPAALTAVGMSVSADGMNFSENLQLIAVPSKAEVFGMMLPWAREFPDRWRTDNVRSLAHTIVEGRTANLPILRDALLDADCDNEKIIRRVATLPAEYWNGDSWLLNVCVHGLEATRTLLGEGDF